MGEREAPPPAMASADADDSIADGQISGFRWPPPGWPMFSCVTRVSGSAFRPDRNADDESFLKYEVSVAADGTYSLEILSGRIGREGISLVPAMGMRFAAREDWFDENPQNAVVDIHVRGQRLIPERDLVLRVILALTFLTSRIDRGQTPSLKRVLKIYRLG